MPVNTTLYSHELLEIGDKVRKCAFVGRMHHLRAIQTLLAFVLLQKEVIATVTIERQPTATRLSDAFLRAAVGLELGHVAAKDRGLKGVCKDQK
jgi:hypothetical protein